MDGCRVWFSICCSVHFTRFVTFARDTMDILIAYLQYRSMKVRICRCSPVDIVFIGAIVSDAMICPGLVVDFLLSLYGSIHGFPDAHAAHEILSVWRMFSDIRAGYSLVFATVCNVDIVA